MTELDSSSRNKQLLLQRLFTAAEQSGAAIAKEHRDTLLGMADAILDTWIDKVIKAVVAALPKGGVKDIEWGPIRNAVLGALPQIDQASNDAVAAFFDKTVAALGTAKA